MLHADWQNLYNPLKLRSITEFTNHFLGNNYYPILNIPTVFHESNPITKFSLIDHVWSNFHSGSNHVAGVIEYLITDHLPLFYIFDFDNSPIQNYIYFRLFNTNCIEKSIHSVYETNFDEVLEVDDPNTAFTVFYKKMFDVYARPFPLKKKKKPSSLMKQPWVTPKLKNVLEKILLI